MSEQVYGRWDKIALQDFILQSVKKIQAWILSPQYLRLRKEIESFQKRENATYSEQIQLSPGSHVLLFKPDDIGDAVYALPAIRKLKEKFPGIHLSLICQKKTQDLYARSGLLEEISAVDVQTRFLRFYSFDLKNALKPFRSPHFEVALFLRTYPSFFSLFEKVPALFHVHPKDPRMKSSSTFQALVSLHTEKRAHQALQMLEIVSRLTGETYTQSDIVFPAFQWKPEDSLAVEKVFGKNVPAFYLVVHPFVKFETRRYPTLYWKEILGRIQKTFSVPMVIVGGKEDPPLDIPGSIQAQGRLNLAETGYLISQSRGFLGVESGPAHWASSMGKPTLVWMGGHSLLEEWGPLGNTLVLQKTLPCFGCHRRACPDLKVKCLTELTPESVWGKVHRFLGENLPKS